MQFSTLLLVLASWISFEAGVSAAPTSTETALAPRAVSTFKSISGFYTDSSQSIVVVEQANGALYGLYSVGADGRRRPEFSGTKLVNAAYRVAFPDDTTYVNILRNDGSLFWSNQGVWTRITGAALGGFTGTFGEVTILETANGGLKGIWNRALRPDFTGTKDAENGGSSATFVFPDDATHTAVIGGNGTFYWTNRSVWPKTAATPSIAGTYPDAVVTESDDGTVKGVFVPGLNRPNFSGKRNAKGTYTITFPDDATYTATVEGSGLISWSNNTRWPRSGPVSIAGNYGGIIVTENASGAVNGVFPGRANFYGRALGNGLYTITFPDDNTYTARVGKDGAIYWSNQGIWNRTL